MTAFARSEQQNNGWIITWEVRSVNHRYLDISVRLPETLRSLEPVMREQVGKLLSRGKVECNLKLQTETGVQTEISLNRPLVERLLTMATELEQIMGPGTGLRPIDVLGWSGVVSELEPDLEQINAIILSGLDKALIELVAMREREGERMAEMLVQRCKTMHEQIGRIRARRPDIIARIRDKLIARLAELPLQPDPDRLEQEMAIIAQRLDIDEELDRLDAHLDEIAEVLQRFEPVGRRLDFLMQELNREANTLSSKSADTETTRSAVELKVLIEQMREQVQNIE